MSVYKVIITETLERVIEVKAQNQYEAVQLAEERWTQGDIILCAEDFTGASFDAQLIPQEKEHTHAPELSL
jgi:hypothetical protein